MFLIKLKRGDCIKKYTANFRYFDKIDSPNKAYWLGFIWADGYIAKRIRETPNGNIRIEYNLKIDIKESDALHLQKFLDDIESDYPIHRYKSTGFGKENSYIGARAFITNKDMCRFLYEDLGIVPRRYDASKVINHIPKEFHKYFILGLFDADGSFSFYQKDSYGKKLNVSFGGSESLLRFIEKHLDENNIVKNTGLERKLYRRHEGHDSTWLSLSYSGKVQGMRILNYLYDSPIYLDRKYQKYLSIPY